MTLTEDFLRVEYIDEQRSCREIAEDIGVVPSTVYYNLLKSGIPLRTPSEGLRLYRNRHGHPCQGRRQTEEAKRKVSEARRGKSLSVEHRQKLSGPRPHMVPWNKSMKMSEEFCKIVSEAHKGKPSPRKGIRLTEEQRRRHSAVRQGISIEEWEGYSSFEPYCHLFNFKLKEKIRNRDNRLCQLCGKSEIINGRRLDVHHIDGDKMQGCNHRRWHLVALCRSCNTSKDTIEKEFLLVSNLGGRIFDID